MSTRGLVSAVSATICSLAASAERLMIELVASKSIRCNFLVPWLNRSTFEEKSDILLSVYSKSREVSASITSEIVIVVDLGGRCLGISVLLRARAVVSETKCV